MPGSSMLRESQSKGNGQAVESSEAQGSAKASKEPKLADHESEVIVACPVPLTSANEMIDTAKGEIIEVLRSDELSARPVDDRLLVGNPRGFDHANRLSRLGIIENGNQDLRTDMDRLKGELKEHARELKEHAGELKEHAGELKEHAGEIADARARIKGLEDSVGDLHNTRSRFISFAKQDKFKSATQHDYQIIAAGNQDVHGGNVIADARLYKHGYRTDFDVYEFLYGLHPSVALMLDYEPTIMLLSRRATYVASPGHAITEQFNELSSKFLGALEVTKYASGYLEKGKKTPATQAHWDLLTFLTCEGPRC